nr:hypothetical protein [Tanacetum cinerariifolium]
MFEVSIILEDDSVELVSGGANGFVNVSLSNSATSSFCLIFVKFIGEFVALMFGEVLGEGESLSIEVEEEEEEEEEALAVSGGGRVIAEIGGLADVEVAWLSTNPKLICLEVKQ